MSGIKVKPKLFSLNDKEIFYLTESSDVHRDVFFSDEDMDMEEDEIDFLASSAAERELLGMWFPMVSISQHRDNEEQHTVRDTGQGRGSKCPEKEWGLARQFYSP